MTKTIAAHFDGRVFVPDEPVELPIGQTLRLRVETTEAAVGKFTDLCDLAVDLPDAPNDLAAQHDHSLYGSPNK